MNRKPVIAIAASGTLLIAAAAGALMTGAASASANLADAAPGASAPAGRVMGTETIGFGAGARVHSVRTSEHGKPEAFVIARPAWLGLSTSYETVTPDEVVYLPSENRIAARS